MRFKINGERNSGTNFLKQLLETNFGRAFDQKVINNKKHYWRHAIPDESIKLLYPGIIDVFIIRDLNDWLVSMFVNPYHIRKFRDFNKFLTSKQKSIEKNFVDAKTNEIINLDDNDKTIFEIRYYKLYKIFEYLKKQDNIIIVNLSNLQDDNTCKFVLSKIKEIFNLKPKVEKYEITFPHTKSKKNIKNRQYRVKIENYKDLIDKYKNNEIEDKINKIFIIKQNNIIRKII